MDELLAYKENAEVQIQQLARQRKVLYRQKREPERAAREEKIKSLTQQMKALRHEVYICSDIETDAAEVQKKLRQPRLSASRMTSASCSSNAGRFGEALRANAQILYSFMGAPQN